MPVQRGSSKNCRRSFPYSSSGLLDTLELASIATVDRITAVGMLISASTMQRTVPTPRP